MDPRLDEIARYYNSDPNKSTSEKICVSCPHPTHADENPSCDVYVRNDKVIFRCRSRECPPHEIWAQVKEDLPQLFPQRDDKDKILKKSDKYKKVVPDLSWPSPPDNYYGAIPKMMHTYRDRDGKPIGLVVYRGSFIGDRKVAHICSVRDGRGDARWMNGHLDYVPIYGLEKVKGKENLPVVLVEGEKDADRGNAQFGDQYLFLTWDSGSNSWARPDWKQIDWVPPEIILWPDNDQAGYKWSVAGNPNSESLADILSKRGHIVRIVDCWENNWPNKYDLSDAIDDRLDIHEHLAQAKSATAVIKKEIYRKCFAARDLELRDAELESTKCGSLDQCRHCAYSHVPLIERPVHLANYGQLPFMVDFAFDASNNQFINIHTDEVIDPTSFNNFFLQFAKNYGDGKKRPVALFTEHPSTLKLMGRTFKPDGPFMVEEYGNLYLNYWHTATLSHQRNDDFLEMWHQLVEHIIPDEEQREHLLDWMAYTAQYPERKIQHQILMLSAPGRGKDSIFKPLTMYFSRHARETDTHGLSDKFSAFFEGTKLLLIQEINQLGGKGRQIENTLKPYASNTATQTIKVEKKGQDPYYIDNYVSIIAMSNYDNPMPLDDPDERRWFVIRFDGDKMDPAFFTKYHTMCDQGTKRMRSRIVELGAGCSSVVQWLLDRDVSAFDAGSPAPMTDAKQMIQENSNRYQALYGDMIDDFHKDFCKDVYESSELAELHKIHMPDDRTPMKYVIGKVKQFKPLLEGISPSGVKRQNKVNCPTKYRKVFGKEKLNLWIVRNYDFWRNQDTISVVEHAVTDRRDFVDKKLRSMSGGAENG